MLQATLNLDAINRCQDVAKPWRLTFCYGRALQGSALTAWNGDDSNFKAVHRAFAVRAQANSKASMGQYEDKLHLSQGQATSMVARDEQEGRALGDLHFWGGLGAIIAPKPPD